MKEITVDELSQSILKILKREIKRIERQEEVSESEFSMLSRFYNVLTSAKKAEISEERMITAVANPLSPEELQVLIDMEKQSAEAKAKLAEKKELAKKMKE
jgi:hypothetical protein